MAEGVRNFQDFLSEHWLAEVFPARLKGLVGRWRTEAQDDKPSPLTGLREVARPYLTALAELPSPRDPDRAGALSSLHGLLLDALGFPTTPSELATEQGEIPVTVPLRARVQGPAGELLHVLQAEAVESLEDLLAEDARLVEPIRVQAGPEKVELVETPARGVQQLLLTADAPRYLLLLAGSWLLLTDVGRWAEGRYLAVDVLGVLQRRDAGPAGELATVAGLCSSDVLLPQDDGTVVVDTFTQDSERHAVAVNEELREGLRDSVEIIANEILDRRRAAGQAVEGLDELPRELTAQSLRFLYRVLFLLYAEARPELAILPVGAPEYGAGYGLDRLRDLVQLPLTGTSRDGHHLHESLSLLFRLVNDGHAATEGEGLTFEALRADLFDPARTPLVDGVRMRNAAVQRVLALLMLSKKSKRRNTRRGFISYGQLGINQLGAVYEGLMSYTGTIATEEMVELARDGDDEKGSWLVPSRRADDYDPEHLVTREDRLTGEVAPVRHPAGSFVFRLSGRDRQRSASYYTPEVLTRCVVRYALEELITEETPAARILEYRICEPALGSGAFLNEALNQLSHRYLEKAQAEQGRPVPPEDYAVELQKVKAYLALHRAYGVDLNATAVELAEISIWLNVMYPELKAPWFGLHLRRGNSVVGARRATYDLAALGKAKKSWLTTPPVDRPLVAGPIGAGEIHHFLLPADGWAAVAGTKQARDLDPERTATLRVWKKDVTKKPGTKEVERLRALARRVERLWTLTRRRLEISEREIARDIDVWGATLPSGSLAVTRERVEGELYDPGSPYMRLRWAMDAWCALWFWPLDGIDPPTLAQWLDGLEAVLGLEVRAVRGQDKLGLFGESISFDDLGVADDHERFLFDMKSEMSVLAAHPWLGRVRDIADTEGFFHWDLSFAQVFGRGGFDLQVGNPPWVRPDWSRASELSELDPHFVLDERMSPADFESRSERLLSTPDHRGSYLQRLASWSATAASLSSTVDHPILDGIRKNLYTSFMERGWRNAGPTGVTAFLHPESHFADPEAGLLRQETYGRLRGYANFLNAARWFDGVDSPTQTFGLHIYGALRPDGAPRFWMINGLEAVETLEESLGHRGDDEIPVPRKASGARDLRGHRARVLEIDDAVLATWAAIGDDPDVPPRRARALRPLTDRDLEVLQTLSMPGRPVRSLDHKPFGGWNETTAARSGLIVAETLVPEGLSNSIWQGPHFTVANPYAKEPNENCRGKADYTVWDLEALPASVVPRTNFQLPADRDRYWASIERWDGHPYTDYWRLLWRKMVQPTSERTLEATALLPGPALSGNSQCIAMRDLESVALVAGMCASIPYDYLVKISGKTNLYAEHLTRFPLPRHAEVVRPIVLRATRLMSLTRDYADLWEQNFCDDHRADSWTSPFSEWPPIASAQTGWSPETPLRSDYERRAALVEIDALAAIGLDLTADQLTMVFRAHFPVLRKYEHEMYFDNQGRKIAKDFHAQGATQQKDDYKLLQAYLRGEDCGDLLDRYEPHPDGDEDPALGFLRPDREAEMRAAHAEFTERLCR